jgi:gas vesicle protein
MMDNVTLQAIIGHLNELKTELKMAINGVKEELRIGINAVYDGQEELKSEISAVKNDIENGISDNMSALETKINAGQEELRQEINVFQERIKDIEAGQAEFEERVTRNHEDLSRKIESTRQDVEATRRDLEATQRDLETHPAALEAPTRRAGGNSAGANADHIQTEAAHAFIYGIQDQEVKQHLLLGGACTLHEALNQAMKLEAAKATSVANIEDARSDWSTYWEATYTTRASPK